MLVYLFIMLWIIVVNYNYSRRKIYGNDPDGRLTDVRAPESQIWWTMGIIVFFIGLRSAGADTSSYILHFNDNLPSGVLCLFSPSTYIGESEWLFKALGVACKTISSSYHLYLLVIAALSGFFVAYTLWREGKKYYADAIILFMVMGTYSWMINGIRQFLAASILFYSSKWIVKKSFWNFLPYAIVAGFIHNSAVIMIPVFFVVHGDAWNKRTLLFLFGGVLSVIFIQHFIGFMDMVTAGTVYDGYMERAQEYGGGSNIIRTLIFAVAPILAYAKRKEINKIATPFVNVSINMSIVCVAISLIANFTSGILIGRLPIYFSLYNLILLPWLLYSTSYRGKKFMPVIMYVCYFVMMFMENNVYYYSDLLFWDNVIPPLHF